MTNLFTRIKNTITADLHEALDHKEKQNPIALLNQYLRQCELETEKVRKLLERQYTLKDEFQKEYQQAVELAEKKNIPSRSDVKSGGDRVISVRCGRAAALRRTNEPYPCIPRTGYRATW